MRLTFTPVLLLSLAVASPVPAPGAGEDLVAAINNLNAKIANVANSNTANTDLESNENTAVDSSYSGGHWVPGTDSINEVLSNMDTSLGSGSAE